MLLLWLALALDVAHSIDRLLLLLLWLNHMLLWLLLIIC
jgi:hypothetical protein